MDIIFKSGDKSSSVNPLQLLRKSSPMLVTSGGNFRIREQGEFLKNRVLRPLIAERFEKIVSSTTILPS